MIPSEIANVGIYLWIDNVSFSYQVPLIEGMKEFNYLKKIIVIDYSCNQNLETKSKILIGKKKDYVFLPWQEIDQLKIKKDTYLFFSKPYLETYKDLDFEKLLIFKKIYLGYSILWSYDERLHFELDFYKKMNKLAFVSLGQKKGYLKNSVPEENLLSAVDPAISRIVALRNQNVPIVSFMLWTPHWTEDWYGYNSGYSTFYKFCVVIWKFALKDDHLRIVIRPHPLLLAKIAEREQRGLIAESPKAKAISAWTQLLELKNVTLSKSDSLPDDLLTANFILSDYSSSAIYTKIFTNNLCVLTNLQGPPVSSLAKRVLKTTLKIQSPTILFLVLNYKKFKFLIFKKNRTLRKINIRYFNDINF